MSHLRRHRQPRPKRLVDNRRAESQGAGVQPVQDIAVAQRTSAVVARRLGEVGACWDGAGQVGEVEGVRCVGDYEVVARDGIDVGGSDCYQAVGVSSADSAAAVGCVEGVVGDVGSV